MGNSKKKKRKKKIGYNSLGMLAIALVAVLLLGGLMRQSSDLQEKLAGYDAKAESLQQDSVIDRGSCLCLPLSFICCAPTA